MAPIALITDYGKSDWFAGEMKGAMLSICPNASIVDISHDIPPGDIKTGAFSLLACYRTFSPGTVFCVVVDPGVGTSRAALAVRAGGYFFVAPDNGVLSWAFAKEAETEIRHIESTDLLPRPPGSTFHGRDLFGPIAAHLVNGTALDLVGPPSSSMVKIPWPAPVRENDRVVGTVVHIDRFGNAISSIDSAAMDHQPAASCVRIERYGTELPFCTHFQQVPTGQGLAYIGSSGFIEIAINNANAAAVFGLHAGDKVSVGCR